MLNWPEYIKLFAGLLAITGPVSAAVVFLGATRGASKKEKNRVALVATVTFILTLLLFTFLGEMILYAFGITLEAFQIAGGILIFAMALDMMYPKGNSEENESEASTSRASLGIVPIGIPLLAGPGAISTIIIYTHKVDTINHDLLVGLSIIDVAVVIYLLLVFASSIDSLMGEVGLTLLSRIFGLITAVMGVEFMIEGIATYFPGLLG